MNSEDRTQLFDEWADSYDDTVRGATGFPFEGYENVLDKIVHLANPKPTATVLDLGCGTGSLSGRFLAKGCRVWGIDSSQQMLTKAEEIIPQATLVRGDLLAEWPHPLQRKFDLVTSAYVFHEFDIATKVQLIRKLTEGHLATVGRIVIGDIAFESAIERTEASERWQAVWDKSEHYWAADETADALPDFDVSFEQVSICAGVFTIERSARHN